MWWFETKKIQSHRALNNGVNVATDATSPARKKKQYIEYVHQWLNPKWFQVISFPNQTLWTIISLPHMKSNPLRIIEWT